jgi:hypothetical protein
MSELPKIEHEIRDPVHDFIQTSTAERAIVNSRPVQRLRWIRQLALTELVYPGCNDMRFEHSLGTMHLASMVFDVVTGRSATHGWVTRAGNGERVWVPSSAAGPRRRRRWRSLRRSLPRIRFPACAITMVEAPSFRQPRTHAELFRTGKRFRGDIRRRSGPRLRSSPRTSSTHGPGSPADEESPGGACRSAGPSPGSRASGGPCNSCSRTGRG